MRLHLALLLAVPALLASSAAGALSLSVAGPTSGPITAGLGVENPTTGSTLSFTVALDEPSSILGYDLVLSWDPAELSFLSATDLSGLGFDVAPVGASPAGERAAAIELSPVSTAGLFQADFQVLAVVSDGAADLRVVANGSGIAPSSLSLANGPAGVAIAVPEPGTALLFGCSCGALCAALRRRPERFAAASPGGVGR